MLFVVVGFAKQFTQHHNVNSLTEVRIKYLSNHNIQPVFKITRIIPIAEGVYCSIFFRHRLFPLCPHVDEIPQKLS